MELTYQEHNHPADQNRVIPIPHTFDVTQVEFINDPNGDKLRGFIADLEPGDRVSIDIETTGLNPFSSEITLIGLSVDGKAVVMLPHKLLDNLKLRELFNGLLSDPSIQKVFHNAKFEMRFFLHHYGSTFKNCDCTLVMRKLLTCGLERAASLAACCFDYLGYVMHKEIREDFIGSLIITDEMRQYCAIDVATTWELYPILNKYLEIEQTLQCYELIEKPCIPVVAKMEHTGIAIDVEFLRDTLQPKFEIRIAELQSELDAYLKVLKVMPKKERKVRPEETNFIAAGYTHVNDWIPSLNVKSSPQVLHVLNSIGFLVTSSKAAVLEQPNYTKGSIELAINTFKRPDVQNEATVLKIGFEICSIIQELRKCRTGLGNFIIPLQSEFTDPHTGKIHGDFNQMGAKTGRFTHSKPNLAQMPKPDEEGVFGDTPLRKAFLPPEGHVFIVYDYDACELRILAEVTKDPTLLYSVTLPDPHQVNAYQMYKSEGATMEECGKGSVRRNKAKNGIYLFVFGGTEVRLAATIRVPVPEAKIVLQKLAEGMPGLTHWQEGVRYCAQTRGFTRSLSGRKRYYEKPDEKEVGWKAYRWAESKIDRQAGNMPIQATSADITKLGMVWADERIAPLGGTIVIQVHDELVAIAPIETAEECANHMRDAMLDSMKQFLHTVESKVAGGFGDRWVH